MHDQLQELNTRTYGPIVIIKHLLKYNFSYAVFIRKITKILNKSVFSKFIAAFTNLMH